MGRERENLKSNRVCFKMIWWVKYAYPPNIRFKPTLIMTFTLYTLPFMPLVFQININNHFSGYSVHLGGLESAFIFALNVSNFNHIVSKAYNPLNPSFPGTGAKSRQMEWLSPISEVPQCTCTSLISDHYGHTPVI